MKELEIITMNVGESTAKTYKSSYERLRRHLNLTDKRKPVKKLGLETLLEKLRDVENPSTKHSMYVIVKKLFAGEKHRVMLDKYEAEIRADQLVDVRRSPYRVALEIALAAHEAIRAV